MATNYFLNQYFTTTLNVGGGIDASQTTGIIVQAVSGLDITKPGVACITYADPINTSTAEWVTYTSIDGSNELQGVTRGAEGFGAKTHSNGAVIAFPLSESHINTLATALSIGGVATNGVTTTLDEDDMASNSATALATQQSIKAYVDTQDTLYTNTNTNIGMARQAIINGNFDVWQRGTAFTSASTPANNDDTFLADRWNVISDGNDAADISQEAITDLPGANYAYKLDVETAKRSGLVQILEAKDAQKFKGKSVSISFAVKSANISAIRATVLSWAGTADSVTSDVIGTWGATPTWATNWADNATPADLTVTSSWTTVKVENIAIDESTVNNLALAIWLPNEETIGDIIYISQVQMCMGSVAPSFEPKSFEEELRACQRYYEKSYNYSSSPGTAVVSGRAVMPLATVAANSTYRLSTLFKVTKRTVLPTVTFYSPITGTSGKAHCYDGADRDVNCTTTEVGMSGVYSAITTPNNAGAATLFISVHYTASDEL